MTAQPAELVSAPIATPRRGPFLGLGTVIRKEFSEWVRGPKALIILGLSVLGAVFMTLIPFIAEATKEALVGGTPVARPDGQRPARLDRPDGRADRRSWRRWRSCRPSGTGARSAGR